MFESVSLDFFQHYWWVLISLLGSVLVALMFVQGGQSLLFQVASSESERSLVINSLGRKWELTFTTLVTFGGAFFASFPLFYSTSFGGAYWLWMIILFSFIVQAVSYEFRKKTGNFPGPRIFEVFLLINGFIAPFLLGVNVGAFFTGSHFYVDSYNLSYWMSAWRGLENLLNIQNVILGASLVFLTRATGGMFLNKTVDNPDVGKRAVKQIKINGVLFTVFFIVFLALLFTQTGYELDPVSKSVSMKPYKYFINLIEMPAISILFVSGAIITLTGIFLSSFKNKVYFYLTSAGTILTVFTVMIISAFNNTPFYPSTYDLQSSLSIYNSSSSHLTLSVMSVVSLLIPIVIAYIVYCWRILTRNRIGEKEIEEDGHKY